MAVKRKEMKNGIRQQRKLEKGEKKIKEGQKQRKNIGRKKKYLEEDIDGVSGRKE